MCPFKDTSSKTSKVLRSAFLLKKDYGLRSHYDRVSKDAMKIGLPLRDNWGDFLEQSNEGKRVVQERKSEWPNLS